MGMPVALPWAQRSGRRRHRSRRGRGRVNPAQILSSKRVRLSLLGLVVAAALAGGGWLWFQDSSFVAVEHVMVTGQSGPDAGAIQAALVSAARSMSTLDVQPARLYGAVSAFPVVKRLEVRTQFPHTMRIAVIERLPVAVVSAGGSSVGVSADGTILRDLARLPALPRIRLPVPPGGPRVTQPSVLSSLAAASAAPRALLFRISSISTSALHGLMAQLRGGPVVYLGTPTNLAAKWSALLAVLANPGSDGASYIDVTDPGRPAAGASGSGASAAIGTSTTGGATGG